MTRFDLDKLLAAAGAELAEEQKSKLLDAMNTVIKTVSNEAEYIARQAFQAQADSAANAQTRNEQFETQARRLLDEVDTRQKQAITEIAQAAREQAADINAQGQQIENQIDKLKTTRVLAELAWNDLPKKIAIGMAAFTGLVVGAVFTILAAASAREEADLKAGFAQRQVVELQQYVEHWQQTAGFELGQYRGDPVVRLEPGQEFVRFVPTIGANTAGNLWKVRSN